MVKMKYGLTKKLSLKPMRSRTSKDKFPDCKPSFNRRLDFKPNVQQILSML